MTNYYKIGIIAVQCIRSIELVLGGTVSAAREPRLGVEDLVAANYLELLCRDWVSQSMTESRGSLWPLGECEPIYLTSIYSSWEACC
jgi:hypothetical protein